VDAFDDVIQISHTPEGSSSDSASSQDHDETATPMAKEQKIMEDVRAAELDEDNISNSFEESEYSAPKFMSLVCIMQMVKLMDAVGILFPHTLPQGVQPITSKKDFLDQFANAKMSAHIDCPNCKAFVSYRWYANDVKKLKSHLASSDQESQKVHLCCNQCSLPPMADIRAGCRLLQPWSLETQAARCQTWPGRRKIGAFIAAVAVRLLFVWELPVFVRLPFFFNFAAVSSILGQF
jgi:hypothetical protein